MNARNIKFRLLDADEDVYQTIIGYTGDIQIGSKLALADGRWFRITHHVIPLDTKESSLTGNELSMSGMQDYWEAVREL